MGEANRGEQVPELASLLRAISERLDRGHESEASAKRDASVLWRIAESIDGGGPFQLRLHRKRGAQPGGIERFQKRLAMAKAVRAYMAEHGCSIAEAAGALTEAADQAGDETMRKAAQEFLPILKLPDDKRDFVLYMKRQEALGRAKVSRVKRPATSGK